MIRKMVRLIRNFAHRSPEGIPMNAYRISPPPPEFCPNSHTPGSRTMSSHPANLLRLAAILVPLALLAACGGGGGSSTPAAAAPMVMLEPLPDPLIADAARARQHIGQGAEAPPSLSSAQIGRTIRTIASDADTLLYDIVGGTSVNCNGTSCTYMDGDGFQIDITTNSFSNENVEEPTGYNEQNTAVMTHNGITVGQRRAAFRGERNNETANFEFQIYGGWGDNNHFAIQHDRETVGNDVTIGISTYSFGDASGTRPTTGTGRWSGTMVGVHTQMNYLVQGSANIRINSFTENRLTILSLFDIKRLDTGADVDNLDWTAVPIASDGTFASNAGDVRGTFYGANHEEIGGVFNRDNIIGAFGGVQTGQ